LLVTPVLVAPLAVMVVALANGISSLIAAATRIFEQGPPAPPWYDRNSMSPSDWVEIDEQTAVRH
jgi:hypothetical protein